MKKIIAIVLCFALLFSLSACSGSAVKKIKDALDSENGEQVNEVYRMSKDNASALKKYDKEIASFINNAIENVNAQNFDADAEKSGAYAIKDYLINEYGTLLPQEGGTNGIASSVSDENSQKWSELVNLIQSKAAYCSGLYSYKTEKDYEYAIKAISEVMKDDSSFENAQTLSAECADLYIKATMEKVEEYIQNNDINAGIGLMKKATEYLNSNNMESGELKTKTDKLLESYAKTYADKAEKAFAEHDVDVAMQNMKIALSFQPDNSDYKSKYDNYELYIPFDMSEPSNTLSIVHDDGNYYAQCEFYDEITANNGDTMTNCILWDKCWYADENASVDVTWNLEGKYDTVSGTIFLPQEDKNTDGNGYFKAYGDGALIYTSPKIVRDLLPQKISFNVSGIQKLKIEFYPKDCYDSFAISNICAQKDFPA